MIVTLAVAVGVSGCSRADNPESEVATEDPGVVVEAIRPAGTRIVVAGSTTVEPILRAVTPSFEALHDDVEVVVEGTGTGDGLSRLCSGLVEIAGASRPMTREELESCRAAGVDPVELAVAKDGVSLVTSIEDPAARCISMPDLYAMVGPGSIGLATWTEVHDRAEMLAVLLEDPTPVATGTSEGLAVIAGPVEGSGTYATLVDLVVEPLAQRLGDPGGALRPDYLASSDDELIAATVSDTSGAIGIVGFAALVEHRDRLEPVAIDAGTGCRAPTAEVIATGDYPLARALFLYAEREASVPASWFLEHFLDQVGDVVGLEGGRVPYVALTEEDLDHVRDSWTNRMSDRGTR